METTGGNLPFNRTILVLKFGCEKSLTLSMLSFNRTILVLKSMLNSYNDHFFDDF